MMQVFMSERGKDKEEKREGKSGEGRATKIEGWRKEIKCRPGT